MGLTTLQIDVGNPANPGVTEGLESLVDSGAIYSVVPSPVLDKFGLSPLTEQESRLANGSRIVHKKGWALFKYHDKIGVSGVIFGEDGGSVLLGAFTLEALGLALDLIKRELRELPMTAGQVRASVCRMISYNGYHRKPRKIEEIRQ